MAADHEPQDTVHTLSTADQSLSIELLGQSSAMACRMNGMARRMTALACCMTALDGGMTQFLPPDQRGGCVDGRHGWPDQASLPRDQRDGCGEPARSFTA
jgi:hypothetical protein